MVLRIFINVHLFSSHPVGDIDKTAFNPGNCSGKIILIIATEGGVQLSIISI